MAKFFIVIDMQNDFVTGSLANPAAAKTIPFIGLYLRFRRTGIVECRTPD